MIRYTITWYHERGVRGYEVTEFGTGLHHGLFRSVTEAEEYMVEESLWRSRRK